MRLARYVFRIAITETCIVGLDDTGFNIRHKLRKPARWRTSRLAGHESYAASSSTCCALVEAWRARMRAEPRESRPGGRIGPACDTATAPPWLVPVDQNVCCAFWAGGAPYCDPGLDDRESIT